MNYVVVRNPQSRFLPQRVRAWLGEEYLCVSALADFTGDFSKARIFPSYQWADSYVHDRNGALRPYASGCVIRATRLEHTIPVEGENESS